MYDNLVGYPKGKRSFPQLVCVRINGKKMVVVLLKVIWRTLMILLDLASRVKFFLLIWSFISRGRLFIILVISIGAEEDGA